jgi:hypothetical protein
VGQAQKLDATHPAVAKRVRMNVVQGHQDIILMLQLGMLQKNNSYLLGVFCDPETRVVDIH